MRPEKYRIIESFLVNKEMPDGMHAEKDSEYTVSDFNRTSYILVPEEPDMPLLLIDGTRFNKLKRDHVIRPICWWEEEQNEKTS